MLQEENKASKE